MKPSVLLSQYHNVVRHIRLFGLPGTLEKIRDQAALNAGYQYEQSRSGAGQAAAAAPLISIIVPVCRTPLRFLNELLDSVVSQTYPRWELCIADGSGSLPASQDSSFSYIEEAVLARQKSDPRIHYLRLDRNLGISGNTNAALSMASGDFIALLDHDDVLTPVALAEVASAISTDPLIDVLYSDEDKTDSDLGSFFDPIFKPDFNPDLLRSCNYITHLLVVRRSLLEQVGGFSDECEGSQDYDCILKCTESARHIFHIPKVLYHWRISDTSVAGSPEQKEYAYRSAVRALENHLARCRIPGRVFELPQRGFYRVDYRPGDNGLCCQKAETNHEPVMLSVCMAECGPGLRCQIEQFARADAVRCEFVSSPAEAAGEYLLMLRHVNRIMDPHLLTSLLSSVMRPGAGAAAPKTLASPGRVLDCGLVFTTDGRLHSPFRGYHRNSPGYCSYNQIRRNVSLVSPYCYAVKTADMKAYLARHSAACTSGVFCPDPWSLVLGFCLAQNAGGRLITVLPDVSVLCRVRRSSLPALKELKGRRDPFYNPNFSESVMYRLPRG